MYIQHRRGVRYIDNTGGSYGNKGVHRSSCRGAALAQCATLQGSPTESALRGHRGIGQGHTGIVGCSKVRTGIPQLRRHRVQGPSVVCAQTPPTGRLAGAGVEAATGCVRQPRTRTPAGTSGQPSTLNAGCAHTARAGGTCGLTLPTTDSHGDRAGLLR